MSRDLTPREFESLTKQSNTLSGIEFMESLKICVDGKEENVYSDELISEYKQFPKLCNCGLDFLDTANTRGLLTDPIGRKIIAEIDNILSGQINDKLRSFADNVNLWYNGKLDSGYYMTQNDNALCEEVEDLMQEYRENPELYNNIFE